MKLLASLLVVTLAMALAWTAVAQDQAPAPTVLGLVHVAVKSTDVPASVAFYCEFLGFAELLRRNSRVTPASCNLWDLRSTRTSGSRSSTPPILI